MKNLVLKKSLTGKIMRIEPLGVEPDLGNYFSGRKMKDFLKKLKTKMAKSKAIKSISKNEAVRICLAVTSLVIVTMLTGPLTETNHHNDLIYSASTKSIDANSLNLVTINQQTKINADDISNGFSIERPQSESINNTKPQTPQKKKLKKPNTSKKNKAIAETSKTRLGKFFAFLKKDDSKTKRTKKSISSNAKKT